MWKIFNRIGYNMSTPPPPPVGPALILEIWGNIPQKLASPQRLHALSQ